MLLLIWQKDILSGYLKVLHTNTAYCAAVGKPVGLTWQLPLLVPRTVSSHADRAAARALAPRYPCLWSCGFPALPEKTILPNSTSLEAEKASLGIHPKQHEWKCKGAVPAPSHMGASSACCTSVREQQRAALNSCSA